MANLMKATGEALSALILWIKMIYLAFCDYLGISEWAIFFVAIGIFTLLAGIKLAKSRKS